MNSLISIVVPLYNKACFVGRTIRSILSQTYQNYEVIIVNDGSTDNSENVVKKHIDSRFTIINQKNEGVSAARNKGITLSRSEHIAFIDADDSWEPDFLETIGFLIDKYPNAGLFCTGYRKIGPGDRVKNVIRMSESDKLIDAQVAFEYASKSYLLSSSSTCTKKSKLEEIGMFSKSLRYGEDLEVWYRLALRYPTAVSEKICANYFFATANNTYQQFSGLDNRFDPFIFLIETNDGEKNLQKSISKFVEIHQLRDVASALKCGNKKDATFLLKRINDNLTVRCHHIRYFVLWLLSIFGFCSPFFIKKTQSVFAFRQYFQNKSD